MQTAKTYHIGRQLGDEIEPARFADTAKNKQSWRQTGLYYYGARYYNPRASLWYGVDPKAHKAPGWTPYRAFFNNPIMYVDPDGQFELPAAQAKKYQRLAHYLKNGVQGIANNKTIVAALKKYGQFTDKQIESALEWGKGPSINVTNLDGANGEFTPNSNSKELRINIDIVEQLENATGEDRDAALLLVASTILHEFTHYGDDQDGVDYTEGHGEEGQAFEEASYGRDIDNLNDAKEVLNEYNNRNGIKKQYSTKSNTIELEEIIITAPKKND
ncbi:MAG: RHS repeat-associated core domain-containing protein [Bacteroidales bacterium]